MKRQRHLIAAISLGIISNNMLELQYLKRFAKNTQQKRQARMCMNKKSVFTRYGAIAVVQKMDISKTSQKRCVLLVERVQKKKSSNFLSQLSLRRFIIKILLQIHKHNQYLILHQKVVQEKLIIIQNTTIITILTRVQMSAPMRRPSLGRADKKIGNGSLKVNPNIRLVIKIYFS